MKRLLWFIILLTPACGHELVSQTYRVEGGRTVGEWFSRGQTVWKVAGEYRLERRGR